MKRFNSRMLLGVTGVLIVMNAVCINSVLATPQQDQPTQQTAPANPTPPATETSSTPAPPAASPDSASPSARAAVPTPAQEIERDPIKRMMKELEALRTEVMALRQQLAQANLDASQAQRERDELRQFLADHKDYGQDFEKYQAVKDSAQREADRRQAEEMRLKREAERADRSARRQAALAELARRDAESRKLARYHRLGFSPLGLDVYISRWSFFYESTDTTKSRIDYQPGIGNYVRLYPSATIDHGKMTISGSVLNSSNEVRNIGVAIAFFDENGTQVGHETVQVNNARPDVPYPFTSKIDMALNRPFDTSSTYVLYADPVDNASADNPASTSTSGAAVTTAPATAAPAVEKHNGYQK
jgi:hypothetical protein